MKTQRPHPLIGLGVGLVAAIPLLFGPDANPGLALVLAIAAGVITALILALRK